MPQPYKYNSPRMFGIEELPTSIACKFNLNSIFFKSVKIYR